MTTEVEILGHKAKIGRISGLEKLEPWRKEDQLVVWLEFDEAVDGVLSFGVSLPAKKYADRDEFLYNVCRRGAEELRRIMARNEVEKWEIQERNERRAALDALAAETQKLIE